jgi:eukaryotic-like serine/threonine-protein kinase
MNPERWKRIEDIFHQALEHLPEERSAFLKEVCQSDDSLQQEIESLLAQERPEHSIQNVVFKAAESFRKTTSLELVGRRIGPYRLTHLIGQGGMGTVYQAVRDDEQYRKQVAIKLIKRGMDTDFILNRFRNERQILATLEHPYTAHLLDGGTTDDGLPFFVMEYIQGQTITEYCATKRYSVTEKLKLFRMVCDAVQHAHRNLIIHRDIKPGNILVMEDGTPKLLDFGIAKLLTPESIQTKMTATSGAFAALTPDYASPEQIRGESVSTATDIYSLGVVLYQLLTGELPYNFKSYTPQEVENVITGTQPDRPSVVVERIGGSHKVRRQLKGDLDNIVLMALRKEPERRYRSVEQFSEDIRRHLEGLPVHARKDTIAYHTGKFISRHKLSLAVVALVILSLVAGIIATMYQARRAERRFEQVRKLANIFLFDFHEKIRNLPGSTEAREMVVKTALEYLDSLAKEAEGDASLQWELAVAYQKVGDVQGNPWGPNLGHTKEAMKSYQKSLNLAQSVAPQHADLEQMRTLSEAYFKLGALQSEAGEKENAGKTLNRALSVAETLPGKSGKEKDLILVADILTRLGDVQLDTGDASTALQSYQRMQKFLVQRAAEFPSDDAQSNVASAYSHVGESQAMLGNLAGAMESYSRSLAIVQALVQNHPTNQLYLRFLRVAHTWLGHISGNPLFINQNDITTSVQHFQKAVAISEGMTRIDPKNARARQDLAIDCGNLADVLSLSAPAQAVELHRKALGITYELLELTPGEFLFLRRKAYFLRGLAGDLKNLKDHQSALKTALQAREILRELSMRDPSNTQIQRDLYATLNKLGEILIETSNYSDALDNYQRILAMTQKWADARPSDLYARWQLADSYSNFGDYHSVLAVQASPENESIENWEQARNWYQKSLNVWNNWPKSTSAALFCANNRQRIVQAMARCDSQLNSQSQ